MKKIILFPILTILTIFLSGCIDNPFFPNDNLIIEAEGTFYTEQRTGGSNGPVGQAITGLDSNYYLTKIQVVCYRANSLTYESITCDLYKYVDGTLKDLQGTVSVPYNEIPIGSDGYMVTFDFTEKNILLDKSFSYVFLFTAYNPTGKYYVLPSSEDVTPDTMVLIEGYGIWIETIYDLMFKLYGISTTDTQDDIAKDETITYYLDPNALDGVEYNSDIVGFNKIVIPSSYPATSVTEVLLENNLLLPGELRSNLIHIIWSYDPIADSWDSWVDKFDTMKFTADIIYLIHVTTYCDITLTWNE